MWNFETELSVRDCVRGVVVSNRAGVCHLLLETGESAVAFFGGISEQTEVLCTVLKLPHDGKELLVSIDCVQVLAQSLPGAQALHDHRTDGQSAVHTQHGELSMVAQGL